MKTKVLQRKWEPKESWQGNIASGCRQQGR